jgi:hypothetical protein
VRCDNLPTGIYADLVSGLLIDQYLAGEWELTYRHDGFIIWTPDRKRIWYTKAGTYGRVQVSTWVDDGELTSVPRYELIHLDL